MSTFKSSAFNDACTTADEYTSRYEPISVKIFHNRVRRKIIFFSSILCAGIPTVHCYGQSGVIFNGDFNNGIIVSKTTPGVWQRYAPSSPTADEHRWKLDSVVTRQGLYSMRVELRPGDTTNDMSDRAELVGNQDVNGNDWVENGSVQEMYYAFSVRLDTNWISPNTGEGRGHGTFLQLHKLEVTDSTGPAFAMQVTGKFFVTQHVGNYLTPTDYLYDLADTDLQRGAWIDFVVRIKYSINDDGEIMIWRKNEGEPFKQVFYVKNVNTLLYQVVNGVRQPLLHKWHTGYYRTRQQVDGTGVTNILWLDGFTFATNAADAQFNAFNGDVVDLPGDGVICAPPIITDSVRNITCNGNATGSIYLKSLIDLSTCHFAWSGPNGFSATTQNIINIGAGVYIYTITNEQGCSKTDSIVVTEPTRLYAQLSYIPILCSGGYTTATITATGGVAPYKGTGNRTRKAGAYSYTIADANSCKTTLKGTIAEPAKLMASASVDSSIKCYGGITTLTVWATGGKAPYTGTGSFVRGVGDYSFFISDSNRCKDTLLFAVKQQPDSLTLSKHLETAVSCKGGNNGSIKLTATGGTRPYQYSFDNGVTFQTDSIKTGLMAGGYNIAVKDANKCLLYYGKISVNEPSLAVSATMCYTKATLVMHVSGKGGTAPYKYCLDGITFKSSNTTDGGYNFSRIMSGASYTVYVRDNNNCLWSKTINTKNLPTCQTARISQIAIGPGVLPYLKIRVMPNPSTSCFTVLIEGNKSAPVNIEVWDIYGRKVHEMKGFVNQTFTLGESLTSGTYILKISQRDTKQTIKIVRL